MVGVVRIGETIRRLVDDGVFVFVVAAEMVHGVRWASPGSHIFQALTETICDFGGHVAGGVAEVFIDDDVDDAGDEIKVVPVESVIPHRA